MTMTLGDAFNYRKKLGAGIQTWTNRLNHAGRDHREYMTKKIEGKDAFLPEPGTDKASTRHYTIEECRSKLEELLVEDQELALRISKTNQQAKARVKDMNGIEREWTIPELLVMKNEIVPKWENIARSIPTKPDGVNIYEEGKGYIKQRRIKKIERKKESFSDKGLKIEEKELEGYKVDEYTEYGIPQREAWNEIDQIQEFAERLKQAINAANKTPLIELEKQKTKK